MKAWGWFLFCVLFGAGIFLFGYVNGLDACHQRSTQTLVDAFELQTAIDIENAAITSGLITATEHRAQVAAAIAEERKKYDETQPACYINRGTVQLLNAARTNQRPDTLHPRLGAGDRAAASTVSQHTLVSGDIDCSARYNAMRDRCNAVFEKIKRYQERVHALE